MCLLINSFSLFFKVQEWRQKAISSESKANQLEVQMYFLQNEIERLRKEEEKTDETRAKGSPLTAMDGQREMEKRVLICRLKENHQVRHASESCVKQNEASSDGRRRKAQTWSKNGLVALERSPLRDIGNSCVLVKQHNKTIYPLVPSNISKN